MCDNYLLSYHENDILEILENPDDNKHYSVNINFLELFENEPTLGNNILDKPEESFQDWNVAIRKAQTRLLLKTTNVCSFKEHTHCRIYSLPIIPELHRNKCLVNDDTNKFLQLTGTVVRMTARKMLEYQRKYTCVKCKNIMIAAADYEKKNIIAPLRQCSNEKCKSVHVIAASEINPTFCKDYQEVKMQESINRLDAETMPNSIWITLEDDLVDSCKPGDSITVCGIIKRRSSPFIVGKKIEVELVVKANHIQVNNDHMSMAVKPEMKDMFHGFWKTYTGAPLAARDIIVKSICPQLYGMFFVKLAAAVVLAGGSQVSNNYNTGIQVRSESHLLLVGDPGTGKSELLRFASKIVSRSVLTTGVGSTAAGLTVTAVMENGEWQLEAGALVLSDGGLCCIDEFSSMKEHDKTSIHEAMEQQTISVAKASMVCKLSTRCTILAATNPQKRLNPSQPLSMNVGLASPLLSRFDLVLLLRDKIDDDYDSKLVDFIFGSQKNTPSGKLNESINWTLETLQSYFVEIKKINPVLSEDSSRILNTYYQIQRRGSCRNKSRTTVRLLESLVRLSQGHARLMYHQEVEIVDAVVAVVLVETTMEADSSVFNLKLDVRHDIPDTPVDDYRKVVVRILKKMELDDLLEKELSSISKHSPPDQPKWKHADVASDETAKKTESKFFTKANAASSSDKENDGYSNNLKRSNSKNDAKRSNSKNDAKRRRIESERADTNDDLALMKCIRSINEEILIGEEIGIDVPLGSQTEKDANHEENDEVANSETGQAQQILPQRSKRKEFGEEMPTEKNEFQKTANKEHEVVTETGQPQPILSQRSKRKEFFNKFRFVSTKADADGADRVPTSSVQMRDEPETQRKPEKVFKFKKVEAQPSTLTVFETPEELDDLDLDI